MVYSLKIALLNKSLCLVSALQIRTSERPSLFCFYPHFYIENKKKNSVPAAVQVAVAELKGPVMLELKFNKTSNSIPSWIQEKCPEGKSACLACSSSVWPAVKLLCTLRCVRAKPSLDLLLFRRHTFLHIKSYNSLGTNTWKVKECIFNCSRISLSLAQKKKNHESFLRILVLFLVTVVKETLSSLALKQIYSIALEIFSF